MTVLFKSCLAYDCNLFTPLEPSCFVAHGMTQCVAPCGAYKGIAVKGKPTRSGRVPACQGFSSW